VHWAVERRAGRLVTRTWLKTRVSPVGWNPAPVPPSEAAALITPTPFLVVHGDEDPYFPVEHAHQLYEAAREPKELWVVPGFGHAESGVDKGLLDRISRWIQQAVQPEHPAHVSHGAAGNGAAGTGKGRVRAGDIPGEDLAGPG
jgi:hypothetical protein